MSLWCDKQLIRSHLPHQPTHRAALAATPHITFVRFGSSPGSSEGEEGDIAVGAGGSVSLTEADGEGFAKAEEIAAVSVLGAVEIVRFRRAVAERRLELEERREVGRADHAALE